MHLPLAFVTAASLAAQPLDIYEFSSPDRCDGEARPMAPATFTTLTGIIVAPGAEIRIDFDDDCETDEDDVLAWAGGQDAQRFLERRDIRLLTLILDPYMEQLGWVEVVPGDVNADDVVDHADLLELLPQLGHRTERVPSPAVDLNGDGAVDMGDLAQLLDRWGDRSEDGLAHMEVAFKSVLEMRLSEAEPAGEATER